MYINMYQADILYPEYSDVPTVEEYIFENPKFRIEVSKREFDGKYVVWRPYVTFNEEGFTIQWECINVSETEKEANEFVKEFLQ